MLNVYVLFPKQDAISKFFLKFYFWKLKTYELAKTSKYVLTSLLYYVNT